MDWDDAAIQRLRDLWAEVPQISTAEIGRRMGITKSAVVGKAHRLTLPARPSPIHVNLGVQQVKRMRRHPMRLPALQSLSAPPPAAEIEQPAPPLCKRVIALPPGRGTRVVECCWPIGEPGTKAFRFCDVPSDPGRSYCRDHCGLAYMPIKDRRERAAERGTS